MVHHCIDDCGGFASRPSREFRQTKYVVNFALDPLTPRTPLWFVPRITSFGITRAAVFKLERLQITSTFPSKFLVFFSADFCTQSEEKHY